MNQRKVQSLEYIHLGGKCEMFTRTCKSAKPCDKHAYIYATTYDQIKTTQEQRPTASKTNSGRPYKRTLLPSKITRGYPINTLGITCRARSHGSPLLLLLLLVWYHSRGDVVNRAPRGTLILTCTVGGVG